MKVATAVVVGAGPNGLAAAVALARAEVTVTVLEATAVVGGGLRSGERTVPGLVHDYFSAFHPVGAASRAWREFELESYGLRWKWPEVDCAHPLPTGEAGLLYQSIERTALGLGHDGERWRQIANAVTGNYNHLADTVLKPLIARPFHPLKAAPYGVLAALPAETLGRAFRTTTGRALYGGVAAHAYRRWDRPMTASVGLMLLAAGHRYGWPVAAGGSQSIAAALVTALEAHGGTVVTDYPVRSASDIPPADVVLLDVSPQSVLKIYQNQLPNSIASAFQRYRMGGAALKLDCAIEGPIPWMNEDCGKAGTVHLSGTFEETAEAERQVEAGIMPKNPFVLLGQQYVADPSRSLGDLNPVWAYAHVPLGHDGLDKDVIIKQIERFAPGFESRIRQVAVTTPRQLEQSNANLVGGDIVGGANTARQLVFRPRLSLNPYSLGLPGVYMCSHFTPPGAGAHGLCGYHAARAALAYLRRSDTAAKK